MSSISGLFWEGNEAILNSYDTATYQKLLLQFNDQIYIINNGKYSQIVAHGNFSTRKTAFSLCGIIPLFCPEEFGNENFKKDYNLTYACMSGAMANGIASEDLVIAMGKAGFMGSFGAAGLSLLDVEIAIKKIQSELGTEKPYAFNLIHSPKEPGLEKSVVELYLKYNVPIIEASAFLDISENIVWYRLAGLGQDNHQIIADNKIIAKISRPEIAEKFMLPAPESIVEKLLDKGYITKEQAELSQEIPLVDDITVEADSGGHTDNRPLISLLPQIIILRDKVQAQRCYSKPIRVGAAGGIATPQSVLAAFMLGADYVVTGSINQASIEAKTSLDVKKALVQAKIEDTIMAPAADMFEMGVNVQVLKKGTMYPMRAKKLYSLYNEYEDIDQIPDPEITKLEKQLFKKSINEVWEDTKRFFTERDPNILVSIERNPKLKMALIFRWYLGQSSLWAKSGNENRTLDYQIWCGPAIGAFNTFVEGSYLADLENRNVSQMALELMTGSAYLFRANLLKLYGFNLGNAEANYFPSLNKKLKKSKDNAEITIA